MSEVTEVKSGGIESVTIKLTAAEALLVTTLCGFGTFHLSQSGQEELTDKGLSVSPYGGGGSNIYRALKEAGI